MGTVQEPVFRANAEYSVAEWLWLVKALLESADKWSDDPWSPFAQTWRQRGEALLMACPDTKPYLDEWWRSPARRHEGDGPPDSRQSDDPRAVAAMGRSADMELQGDVSILRRAYEHVTAFADPRNRVRVGNLPVVRVSEWDPSPFKAAGRKTVMPIPDVRQALLEEEAVRERQAPSRRQQAEQPHFLFRPVSSFFGKAPVQASGNKVFVVHGRDHGPRDAIRLVLHQLGLEPVVLEDEANRGRTLIEKFEQHADVSYAVVILTPEDEVTATAGTTEMRPRQNVVLEFGYLMGHLGRARVAVVVVGQPTGPSDVDGIAYIPYDQHGGWKLRLANELQDAGFAVETAHLK